MSGLLACGLVWCAGRERRARLRPADRLAGSLSGGDGRGLWRLLQRFVAELGRGGEADRAVEDTVGQLVAAAGGGS